METFESLPNRLFDHAAQRPDEVALREVSDGSWRSQTWAEVASSVERLAAGLIRQGVEPQDRVLIWGENSARWMLADLATMTCGAVTVPVYANSIPSQAGHILRESGAKVAFLNSAQYFEFQSVIGTEHSNLTTIVLMKATPSSEASKDTAPRAVKGVPLLSWEEFESPVDDALKSEVHARLKQLSPEHLATIIYTSGTGGVPKGVMLDHRSIVSASDAVLQMYLADANDSLLSYLPLAHVVERLLSVFLAVSVGGGVSFAESIERMPDNLREVQPTIFAGVPRVWEKFVEGIQRKVAGASPLKRAIFALALSVGARLAALQDKGRRPNFVLGFFHRVASNKVYQPLRKVLGLNRALYLVSGGAPLRQDTIHFLRALDLPVMEVYGQTETIATSINTPAAVRHGSVGQPTPGMQVRFAPDGEIEVFSDYLFRGYWQNEEATREAFTEDGWFKTGDLGRLDSEGFLYITGRKKAILITAGGKNVAPEPIEAELSSIAGVAQAVVVGDQRKYIAALLTLDEADARQLASDKTVDGELLVKDPNVLNAIQAGIDAVNGKRASFEQIKRFCLLPRPFSVENEELTPTLKIRRNVVEDCYTEEIEALYH